MLLARVSDGQSIVLPVPVALRMKPFRNADPHACHDSVPTGPTSDSGGFKNLSQDFTFMRIGFFHNAILLFLLHKSRGCESCDCILVKLQSKTSAVL
jgi:hypothetical protein